VDSVSIPCVDHGRPRSTVDQWVEVVAGSPECGHASVSVAGVSSRGAERWRGRRGTRLRRRLGTGSLELGNRRRGAGGGDGTRWRLGSGVDKRESEHGGVVGEESDALVPFIGWRRRGAARRGGEQLVARGIKALSYCASFGILSLHIRHLGSIESKPGLLNTG
jgi:hypothetical protein